MMREDSIAIPPCYKPPIINNCQIDCAIATGIAIVHGEFQSRKRERKIILILTVLGMVAVSATPYTIVFSRDEATLSGTITFR